MIWKFLRSDLLFKRFFSRKKLQRPDFHDASTLTVSVQQTDTCGIRNLLFI